MPFARHRFRNSTCPQPGGRAAEAVAHRQHVPKTSVASALPASSRPTLLERDFNLTDPVLRAAASGSRSPGRTGHLVESKHMAPFFFKENHNRSHSRTSYNLTDTSCVITGCTALPGKRQRDGIPNPRAGIWAPCCTIGPSGTFTAQQELEHFCLWAPNF